jgi:hypothetical protein
MIILLKNLIISSIIILIFIIFIHLILINFTSLNKSKKLIFSYAISFTLLNVINFFLSNTINFFYFTQIYIGMIFVYTEFYSLISRGFTISIITNLKKNKNTLKELEMSYANKKSLKWMLNKRINDLKKLKIIKKENNLITLSKIGKITYIFLKILNKIFGVRKNG